MTLRRVGAAIARLPAAGLVLLVRVYQRTLSHWLGGHCRFTPTCSQYFIEAVQTHGALRGGAMGLWRIVRCNPLTRGGYDPVSPPAGKKYCADQFFCVLSRFALDDLRGRH